MVTKNVQLSWRAFLRISTVPWSPKGGTYGNQGGMYGYLVIIEQHKGAIKEIGEYGKGGNFEIKLPISQKLGAK